MLGLNGESGYYPTQVDVFHLGVIMFQMVTAGCNPFEKRAVQDDKVYKYIQLDRDDLFYAILTHEEIYKNHKSLSKGVKTLISFMISFLPHERPSAAEVLAFIGKI